MTPGLEAATPPGSLWWSQITPWVQICEQGCGCHGIRFRHFHLSHICFCLMRGDPKLIVAINKDRGSFCFYSDIYPMLYGFSFHRHLHFSLSVRSLVDLDLSDDGDRNSDLPGVPQKHRLGHLAARFSKLLNMKFDIC